MPIRPPTAALGLLLAATLATMPIGAQSQSGDGSRPGQQEDRVLDVTEEKFSAFVDAAVIVRHLTAFWTTRISRAPSRGEAQQLARQASLEITQAVEDTPGITPNEYAAIAQAAQQNEQLAERINSRILAAERDGG